MENRLSSATCEVYEVLKLALNPTEVPEFKQEPFGIDFMRFREALEQLETFLQPVIEASERRRLLEEVIQGRFWGLAAKRASLSPREGSKRPFESSKEGRK